MLKSKKCTKDNGSDLDDNNSMMGSDFDLDELLKEIDEEDSDHENENNNNNNQIKKDNEIQNNLKMDKIKKITNDKKEKNILEKKDTTELVNIKKSENNNNDKKRLHIKNKAMIKHDDELQLNTKKQKITNDEDHGIIITEDDKNKHLFQKIVKEYIHLPLMKRIDQYIDELKKENIPIPLCFDMKVLTVLDNWTTSLEELFQQHFSHNDKDSEKNKAIRHTLIAQYLFYTWLRKNNFIPNENFLISEQDKKYFVKWINDIHNL